jgi:hypothetical protein
VASSKDEKFASTKKHNKAILRPKNISADAANPFSDSSGSKNACKRRGAHRIRRGDDR